MRVANDSNHPQTQYGEYLRIVKDYCNSHPNRPSFDRSMKLSIVLFFLGGAGTFVSAPGLAFASSCALLAAGYLWLKRTGLASTEPVVFANYISRQKSIALEDALLGKLAESELLFRPFKRYLLNRLDERGTVSTNDVEIFFDGYRSDYHRTQRVKGVGAEKLRLAANPATQGSAAASNDGQADRL
jgi:hypothetical protein